MRKRHTFAMLLVTLLLFVAGCGDNKKDEFVTSATTGNDDTSTEIVSEENSTQEVVSTTEALETTTTEKTVTVKKGAKDNAILSFDEEIIIAEDDNVTVRLKGIFQELVNWSEGPEMEKGIILSVTNNGSYDYIFNLEDLYLLDEGASSIMNEGNGGPAPGKTREYSYYINKDSISDRSIEKLNYLSGLNGNIALEIYSDDKSYIDTSKSYTIYFSLEDYKTQIDNLVDDNIDYSVDSTIKQESVSGNTEVGNDFDVLGTWYCLRGGSLEDTPEFKEDGTVVWSDKSVCTWELKPEKNSVYLYYPEYNWGGDYAINEYNGYYLIKLSDITMVRKENYDDYIHSTD